MWTIDKLLTVCRDEWPALTWRRSLFGVVGQGHGGYPRVSVYRADWLKPQDRGPAFRSCDAAATHMHGFDVGPGVSRVSQLRAVLRRIRYALPDEPCRR